MDEENTLSWKRLIVEGAVIVVSILLAFGIDAWWDEQNARRTEREQLVSVALELKANSERLQRKLDVILFSIEGTEDLAPTLHDVVGSGFVNQNLASKFPYDQLTFLAFSRPDPA